jgi:hypothetical protein
MATLVEIYRMRERGDFYLAIEEAEERLTSMTCSQDGSMWLQLNCIVGDVLLDLKKFAEAEARFDLVWTQCRDPVALSNRGFARWKQGKHEAAFKDMVASIKAEKDSENVEVAFRNAMRIAMDLKKPEIVLSLSEEYVGRFRRTKQWRQLIADFDSRYPELAQDSHPADESSGGATR